MLKLMKYEFRKTMFSKMAILVITALSELAYLAGVFLKNEKALSVGLIGLVMCGMIGLFYIGIDSMISLHRDLNTKQSYMLFLTPRNSYQVLGAKVLENGISLFLSGAFFAVLAAADFSIGILYIGGVKEFLDMLNNLMKSIQISFNVEPQVIALAFFSALASWLLTIVTGDLAIILSATVFAGKKFSGFVSFILFLLISFLLGKGLDLLPVLKNQTAQYAMLVAAALVLVALMYALAGWIMEHRLSV